VRQNNDMRRISAWGAIWAIPTLPAGIYGMNFQHLPVLGWRFGYTFVLVVMLVICLALYRGSGAAAGCSARLGQLARPVARVDGIRANRPHASRCGAPGVPALSVFAGRGRRGSMRPGTSSRVHARPHSGELVRRAELGSARPGAVTARGQFSAGRGTCRPGTGCLPGGRPPPRSISTAPPPTEQSRVLGSLCAHVGVLGGGDDAADDGAVRQPPGGGQAWLP
jgi:CorA-like Mg2+ transporter protein